MRGFRFPSLASPLIVVIACILSPTFAGDPFAPAGLEGYNTVIKPFLSNHCFDCHDGDKPKANMDLTKLSVKIETRP